MCTALVSVQPIGKAGTLLHLLFQYMCPVRCSFNEFQMFVFLTFLGARLELERDTELSNWPRASPYLCTSVIVIVTCFDVLAEELAGIHVHIKLFKKSTTRLKKVTKISKVSHVLKKSRRPRNALRKYIIYYGIALVSASAERSFSVMRKIKTWLRLETL